MTARNNQPGSAKGQGLDNTRQLLQATFVAGAAQPVENPRQRGFASDDRMDKLILCFDGTAVEPGGQANIQFDTQAQAESFYSAWIGQIRLNSAALPDLIEQQTGIRLSQNCLADGIIATGLPSLGVPVATPAGTWTFNVRLELPYTSEHQARVQAAHAPYMGYLFDNGLQITLGDGNITSSAGGVYALAATAQLTARIEYTSGLPIAKVSAYSYMNRAFNQRQGNDLPTGVYFSLGCPTQVPSALAAQAIDSGVRVYIDGQEALPFAESDPCTNVSNWLSGMAGRGASVREFARSLGDPAALSYYPIIANPVNSHEALRPEAEAGVVLDFGTNFAVANEIVGKRVPFMDTVGQGQGACAPCNTGRLRVAGYPLSSTADPSRAKGARTAPQIWGG